MAPTLLCHAYVHTYVTRKVHKTVIVDEELADRLDDEDNMSQTVRNALREWYDE